MKLCVIHPSSGDPYSATFIRGHFGLYPGTLVLRGGAVPVEDGAGHPLLSRSWPARAFRSGLSRALGIPYVRFEKAAVIKILLAHGVEAVLAEYGITGAACADLCRKAGIPLVTHFHGYDLFRRRVVSENREGYARMFESAGALVAVSSEMAETLRRLGAPPGKVKLNPYGVDTGAFDGAMPDRAPPLLAAAGRFVPKKAPDLTIRAFARAASEHPAARLCMIGDGELLPACRALAAELGVTDRIDFSGALPHAEVARLFRSARAFVQHSMEAQDGDREGTPVAVLEAMASGLPVIATRHAGIAEAVVPGETGLLVEEGDWEAMSRDMSELIGDPRRAAGLGRAGRQRALACYSREKSDANLRGIIEEAVRSARSR